MSTCGIPDPSSYIPPTPCPLVPFTPPANVPTPSPTQLAALAETGNGGMELLVALALIALVSGVFLIGYRAWRRRHGDDVLSDQPIADRDPLGHKFEPWEDR